MEERNLNNSNMQKQFQHEIAVVLTYIFNFVAVQETSVGDVSANTEKFIKSLNTDRHDATYLFGTNLEVDVFNSEKLNSWPGEAVQYHAKDEGNESLLNKIVTPKVST